MRRGIADGRTELLAFGADNDRRIALYVVRNTRNIDQMIAAIWEARHRRRPLPPPTPGHCRAARCPTGSVAAGCVRLRCEAKSARATLAARNEDPKLRRLRILREAAHRGCEDCAQPYSWYACAQDLLIQQQKTIEDPGQLARLLHDALRLGRGKDRNVFLIGPGSSGKSMGAPLSKPLPAPAAP